MKRARTGLIAAAILAVASVAFAQKPDFSGTWTLDPEASGAPAGGGGGGGGAAVDAKALFTSGDADTGATACATCHTLADAGAKGQVGPDLDKVLKGKDAAFIKESILDPDKEIAPGFQPGVMPGNFGDTLSGEQVDALVKYLSEVTNK